MGVVNITPDSFSDGGKFTNIDSLKKRVSLFKRDDAILDIGAESTAPFNKPISLEEELSRYQQIFFPLLESNEPLPSVISVDTYRKECFLEVYQKIKKHLNGVSIIWNDVSGIIDDDVLSVLHEYRDVYYVYCHTNVKNRNDVSSHMHSLFDDCDYFVDDVINYFHQAKKKFHNALMNERVIFDPAFGFSKNYNQNIKLIKNIGNVLDSFDQKQAWVLGISRKSFLKKQVFQITDEFDACIQTEFMSAGIITNWLSRFCGRRILYRMHDPTLFDACLAATKMVSM